jgi:hypothetical protein
MAGDRCAGFGHQKVKALVDAPAARAEAGGRLWDADFMLGPSAADGTDSYVLGEINVSSVFPIPPTRPQQRSPAGLPIGCGRCAEWFENRPAMVEPGMIAAGLMTASGPPIDDVW